MKALKARREIILRVIVDEYIRRAMPVASRTIAQDYDLKVSPATIRNDMAYLEGEGYITRPHHSAGGIPTDKAYRYYVESLRREVDFSGVEQHSIYHPVRKTRDRIEPQIRWAVFFLARFVHNLAIITSPKTSQSHFKHLDLVSLQDFVALLVLVLYRARIRQRFLSFDEAVSQGELTSLANRLNAVYAGMTSDEILAEEPGLSPLEQKVAQVVVDVMEGENRLEYGKPYIEGLYLLLSQPEFSRTSRVVGILELLEKENWLANVLGQQASAGKVEVIIGGENAEEALRDFGLVVGHYGVSTKAGGIVGVIGPKRMDYSRAISSVNSVSTLLSKSVAEYIQEGV